VKSSPSKIARILLILLACCTCFLNYWEYSRQYHSDPTAYMDIVQGTANAPQQYRVLVVRSAWFLHQHAHLELRHAFTLFDLCAALIAGFTLLGLMERTDVFQRFTRIQQWLSYASVLFLFAYFLIWLEWYQRPETLPTACFIALMLALLSTRAASIGKLLLIAVGTVALAFLQALTRADVAFCFYAGAFLLACLPAGRRLHAPRAYHLVVSACGVLTAVTVQWIMMHRIYPHATYGDTAVFQLKGNLEPGSLLPFLLFLAPILWLYWFLLRRRPEVEAHWLALVIGAALFVPLWATVGRIQEVRIFLPFALCLAPLVATQATKAIGEEPS
jgi:hypothetical protein